MRRRKATAFAWRSTSPTEPQTFTDLIVTANPPADATNTIPLGTAADTAAALTKRFENQAVASIQGKASLGLAANFGTGTPASVELAVKAPPAAGDTLTFKLALRDGTTQTITLTAKANADAKSTTEFSLTGDVAANISTALSNALKETAGTTLSASSASRATQDFFAGSKTEGFAPRRVSADGNGYAEGASTTTVIWYTGDDTSTDPRATASVQIGSDRKIGIGAQANEAPIRAVLAGIAQVAVQSFTTTQTGNAGGGTLPRRLGTFTLAPHLHRRARGNTVHRQRSQPGGQDHDGDEGRQPRRQGRPS